MPGLVSTVSVNAAIGIYSAVASGMIALTGIVFSLTFVMVHGPAHGTAIVNGDGSFSHDGQHGQLPQTAIADLIEQIAKAEPDRPAKDVSTVTFAWRDKDGTEMKKRFSPESAQALLDKITALAEKPGAAQK